MAYCGRTDCDNHLYHTHTKPSDPAYCLLEDGFTTKPTVYDRNCYICNDPEFAQMGLPLCNPCPKCTAEKGTASGHIPADDMVCTECDREVTPREMMESEANS